MKNVAVWKYIEMRTHEYSLRVPAVAFTTKSALRRAARKKRAIAVVIGSVDRLLVRWRAIGEAKVLNSVSLVYHEPVLRNLSGVYR